MKHIKLKRVSETANYKKAFNPSNIAERIAGIDSLGRSVIVYNFHSSVKGSKELTARSCGRLHFPSPKTCVEFVYTF